MIKEKIGYEQQSFNSRMLDLVWQLNLFVYLTGSCAGCSIFPSINLVQPTKQRVDSSAIFREGKIDFLYTTRSPKDWDWKCSTYMSVPLFSLLFYYITVDMD